jgi:hypothetical protein
MIRILGRVLVLYRRYYKKGGIIGALAGFRFFTVYPLSVLDLLLRPSHLPLVEGLIPMSVVIVHPKCSILFIFLTKLLYWVWLPPSVNS